MQTLENEKNEYTSFRITDRPSQIIICVSSVKTASHPSSMHTLYRGSSLLTCLNSHTNSVYLFIPVTGHSCKIPGILHSIVVSYCSQNLFVAKYGSYLSTVIAIIKNKKIIGNGDILAFPMLSVSWVSSRERPHTTPLVAYENHFHKWPRR